MDRYTAGIGYWQKVPNIHERFYTEYLLGCSETFGVFLMIMLSDFCITTRIDRKDKVDSWVSASRGVCNSLVVVRVCYSLVSCCLQLKTVWNMYFSVNHKETWICGWDPSIFKLLVHWELKRSQCLDILHLLHLYGCLCLLLIRYVAATVIIWYARRLGLEEGRNVKELNWVVVGFLLYTQYFCV